jgi:hypothetical protein
MPKRSGLRARCCPNSRGCFGSYLLFLYRSHVVQYRFHTLGEGVTLFRSLKITLVLSAKERNMSRNGRSLGINKPDLLFRVLVDYVGSKGDL